MKARNLMRQLQEGILEKIQRSGTDRPTRTRLITDYHGYSPLFKSR